MAITKVEYFSQGIKIGEKTTAPFNEFVWTDKPIPGTYTITAKVYGDGVLNHTSTPVDIVVLSQTTNFPEWELNGETGSMYQTAMDEFVPNQFDVTIESDIAITTNKSNGAVNAPNGKIYTVPGSTTAKIVVYNGNDDSVYYLTPPMSDTYQNGVLAPNRKIYANGVNGNILVINTDDDTMYTITTTMKKSFGILGQNGNIFFIPNSDFSSVVQIFDPGTETFVANYDGMSGYGRPIIGLDGYIRPTVTPTYPHNINTMTNVPDETGVYKLPNEFEYWCVGADGCLYSADDDSSTATFYRWDPNTQTGAFLNGVFPNHNSVYGNNPILGPDGKIYIFPIVSGWNTYIIDTIPDVNGDRNVVETNSSFYSYPAAIALNVKGQFCIFLDNTIKKLGAGDLELSDNFLLSRYTNNG